MLGDDLTARGESEFIVDTFGLDEDGFRREMPSTFQLLSERVLPERAVKRDRAFRERWWLFGRNRPELRAALADLARYIGTTETAKHRFFQFVRPEVLPDHMVVAIASRTHTSWAFCPLDPT